MSNTPNLKLPLLAGGQAQKHVTVNEALVRLDALSQLVLEAVDVTEPPVAAPEGSCWAIGAGPTGDWSGFGGHIALSTGGGWEFIAPAAGWRAALSGSGQPLIFDGAQWTTSPASSGASGAGMVFETIEIEHVLGTGAQSDTGAVIPAGALVLAVTGRVTGAIAGTATAWKLGVAGAATRYGSGLGVATGSWLRGVTGSPVAYYSATPLRLTAEGGDFAGGTVRLAVHLAQFTLPAA